MQSKLYDLTLPPLKRYKLYHQESVTHHQIHQKSPQKLQKSNLPAKKRKFSRTPPSPPPVYSLPAKKRIWATPPFDLNLVPKVENFTKESEICSEIDQESDDYEEGDDDGVVCCVCQSTDGDEKDPIVLCDGCDVMVHCSCYGYPLVEGVPEGDWFCEQCLDLGLPKLGIEGKKCCVCNVSEGGKCCLCNVSDGKKCCLCSVSETKKCCVCPVSEGKKRCVCAVSEGGKCCICPVVEGKKCCVCPISETKKCCLCPVSGGAMKATNDGKWAHIVCALFIPEVFFEDPEGRERIDCSMVPRWRFEGECYLCESRNGCVLDCSEAKCPLSFHVTCGVNEDLYVEYQQGKKKSDVVAGFCRKHTDLWQKQQQTGKYKIVARD